MFRFFGGAPRLLIRAPSIVILHRIAVSFGVGNLLVEMDLALSGKTRPS